MNAPSSAPNIAAQPEPLNPGQPSFSPYYSSGEQLRAAEALPDLRERCIGQGPAEEHGDLPRSRDRLGAVAALEVGQLEPVVVGDELPSGVAIHFNAIASANEASRDSVAKL